MPAEPVSGRRRRSLSKKGIIGLGRGSGGWICLSSLMLFINGAAYIGEVILIAFFIGNLGSGGIAYAGLLLRFLLSSAGIMLIKAAASRLGVVFSSRITTGIKMNIRSGIFDKVKRLGPAYLDSSGTAELISNTLDGVESLEIFFGRLIPQLIYSLIIPVLLFCITIGIYPLFALVMLCAVPVIPLSMIFIGKWAKRSMSGFWDDYQGLSSLFLENLQGIVTLKLFNKSGRRMEEMESRAWGFRNSTMELLRMQLTSITVMDTLVYGFAGVGIALAVFGLHSGGLTLREFFILLMLSVEFFLPLRKLGSLFHAGVNGIQAGKKINLFLDSPEPLQSPVNGEAPRGTDIVFENVSFSYKAGQPEILSDACFRFKAGQVYGILGPSGCGKSTMGRLLLRFIAPGAGIISFGGIDMSEIPRESLRRRITLVEANSRIFGGTIADNLRLAAPDACAEQMLSACRAAGLGGVGERRGLVEEAADLGRETGESGSRLSGGERQRLAIARAILLDPEVFVFDEASGSVDSDSEDIIRSTILNLPAEKTVFIISHRMSMLEGVDSLLTIEGGKIVERAGSVLIGSEAG